MSIHLGVKSLDTCSNVIKDQLPTTETPLYLRASYNGQLSLIEPTSGSLEVELGEKLIISCPGDKNAKADKNTKADKTTKAAKNSKSKKNTNVEIIVKTSSIACDLQFHKTVKSTTCTKSVKADVQKTTSACFAGGRYGKIHEVGYKVPFAGRDQFVQLFEVCYSYETGSALYAHHQINGNAIGGGFFEKFHFNNTIFRKNLLNCPCWLIIDNLVPTFRCDERKRSYRF